MTTENKRVAAYLPQPLYDLLERFKKENNLSESKAIISILAAHFGVAQEVSQKVAHHFVTIEQFNELQEKVAHISELFSDLKESQQENLKSDSNSESFFDSEEIPHPGQKGLFDVASPPIKSELVGEPRDDLRKPLTVVELAERFELTNPRSIDNKRSKLKDSPSKFLDWTKDKDNEGIGWEYHPEEKLYYPMP